MADNEAKAKAEVAKAENKLKGGWFKFLSREDKWEEAAELYANAAKFFKMAKMWHQAGDVQMKAAECHLKAQSKHDAASSYVDACGAFKKSSPPDAIRSLRLAIDIFADMGRFSQAAKWQKDLAALYLEEADVEQAIRTYQEAADAYEADNSTGAMIECLRNVAQHSAELERYEDSVRIYEHIANLSLPNDLLKYKAKDYFLRAGILRLISQDIDQAREALERYKDLDINFPSSRECDLLTKIVAAFDENDVQAFTDHLAAYDAISKLDQWKVSMLLRVKKRLEEDEDVT